MPPTDSRSSPKTLIASVVPSFVGWRSYPHAVANLLVFGLAVVLGEWIVHQLEYLIEYGRRFGAVIGSTPHRYYTGQTGVALGIAAAMLLAAAVFSLLLAAIERRRLLRLLPPRISRHVPTLAAPVPFRALTRTALALTTGQIVLYLLQENLERAAVSGAWPGLWVLFAPQHWTVLPLHLLLGVCISILLCTLSAWLSRSQEAVRLARALVGPFARRAAAPERLVPAQSHVPNLRLAAGILCLRSPPLAV